jgi:hypothetical protein
LLKRRLYEAGLKERRCELCGQGEEWRGRRMSLILDHINGVRDDNRLENLRIICPNCAATLETHCGKKAHPRLTDRRCRGCGKSFRPTYVANRYCSPTCFHERQRARGARMKGVPRPHLRKVERPPFEQLLREIEQTSYLAVARNYGVSDNAIRKWVRQYQREAEKRDSTSGEG